MNDEVKTHITSTETWLRLLFMVMFAVISWVSKLVLIAVVIFQSLLKLLTGTINERALDLGQQLSTYIYQILRYLTFNTEERPYPFSDWPSGDSATEPAAQPGPVQQAVSTAEAEPAASVPDEPSEESDGNPEGSQ